MGAAGISGQFGYATETTTGTAVTVTKFLPIVSENVVHDISRLDSMGIRAGRRITAAWKPGIKTVSGSVELEMWNHDVATLLKHMFGTVATATNGSLHDYTYSPADLTSDSFTAQVGRPDITGTVRPFTWAGCKIGGWTLSANVDEIAMLSLDLMAQTETNGTALASASYDTSLQPFVFTEGYVLVAGATNSNIRSFELSADNNLTFRHRFGAQGSQEILENGFRDFTGTIESDFEDLTAYNRFLNATESALVFKLDDGTDSLTLTMNVRYDGESPTLDGPELLTHSLPFKVISATSDAAGITAVLTNGEGLTGAA